MPLKTLTEEQFMSLEMEGCGGQLDDHLGAGEASAKSKVNATLHPGQTTLMEKLMAGE